MGRVLWSSEEEGEGIWVQDPQGKSRRPMQPRCLPKTGQGQLCQQRGGHTACKGLIRCTAAVSDDALKTKAERKAEPGDVKSMIVDFSIIIK